MAEAIDGKRRFNGLDLAHALSEGARTAYGAVAKPVEGTILTVIRESAVAAVAAAEHDDDLEAVLAATVDAAEKSVARTPTLLAILREAGVVDSGGQGVYRLFQGALLHMVGRAPADGRPDARRGPARSHRPWSPMPTRGSATRPCTCSRRRPARPLDVDAIRGHLESIGESVLVAGDARALKIHVHNERPDLVIAFGLAQGSLSKISVENLDNQARDVRETRAAEFTTSPTAGGASAPSEGRPAGPPRTRTRTARARARDALGAVAATRRHRGRRGRWPRGDLPGLRRRRRDPGRPDARTRAPASCSRRSSASMPARSSSCRTTRTWCSPPARSRR